MPSRTGWLASARSLKLRLVVNLRAAGQLGLVLPPALRCAASR
jgi:hypothetical protein